MHKGVKGMTVPLRVQGSALLLKGLQHWPGVASRSCLSE